MTDFRCQLADAWTGTLDPAKRYISEPKLDGMRCLLFLDPNEPRALSRNGKPVKNMGKIVEACMQVAAGLVIDGELFAGDWHSSISAGRAEGSTIERKLWAFDAIPLEDFNRQSSAIPLRERKQILREFGAVEGIKVVPSRSVTSPAEVLEVVQEYVKAGFEGGVIKDLDAPYLFDRGGAWMKLKFCQDAEFPCVSVYEGGGRLKGSLGGIVINVNGVEVGVGTGFNDLERDHFWQHPESIVGKLVTVEYQRKSPYGSLISPVFLRVRESD